MNNIDIVIAELAKADTIISVLLQHLTQTEKNDCAEQLSAQGVIAEDLTRASEREKVLAENGFDISTPSHKRKFFDTNVLLAGSASAGKTTDLDTIKIFPPSTLTVEDVGELVLTDAELASVLIGNLPQNQ